MTAELAPYLPAPHIVALADEQRRAACATTSTTTRPHAIGKLRAFLGNLGVVLRAYAWTMSLGARGLREVAEVSVLNNNYLEAQLREMRGVGYPFAPGRRRLDQIRYSFGELKEETGFGTVDMRTRFCDYGVQTWFMSHHPWIVPEPFTPEPCESYSKEDIDYWAAAMKASSDDAYETPEHFAAAPHNQSCRRISSWERLEDPAAVGGHLARLPAQASGRSRRRRLTACGPARSGNGSRGLTDERKDAHMCERQTGRQGRLHHRRGQDGQHRLCHGRRLRSGGSGAGHRRHLRAGARVRRAPPPAGATRCPRTPPT